MNHYHVLHTTTTTTMVYKLKSTFVPFVALAFDRTAIVQTCLGYVDKKEASCDIHDMQSTVV